MSIKKNARLLLLYIVGHASGPLLAQNFHSGIDPLSIPLQERRSFYNKGNLAPNASFEQGLTHWTVIGKNVELTDTADAAHFTTVDAHQSRHAIKITRSFEEVDEMGDQPYGVLSDYIEVLPANFDFFFDIRLEKIIPTSYLDRFTTRVDKNIDIHLVYYDKNKKELSPGIWFEYIRRKIDNGFKGFAFSNYSLIDKFPWARVHGESWTYPFSEGDMPENCRYVRIFFGLKCSGSIWVDNIDFRLSRWNFTPEERVDSFFHKQFSLAQLLIPTPHAIGNEHSIRLASRLHIVCPGAGTPESRSTLDLLQQRLKKIKRLTVTVDSSGTNPPGLAIVLLKADAPAGFDSAFAAIRGKAQGYFIRNRGNRIYLGANTDVGLFYAATTLCQLIDDRQGTLDYADITDYPEFKGRTVRLMDIGDPRKDTGLAQQIKDLDFYAFYKLNELYSYASFNKKWWEPGPFYATFYNAIGKRCADYGDILHSAVQLNTYYHFAMEQQVDSVADSLRNEFIIGGDEGFKKVTDLLRVPLDAGVRTVELCSDDFVPHSNIIRGEYTLFTDADRRQFTNLAAAQSFLVNRTKKWLDAHYPGVRLEFIPPPYNNRFIDNGRGTAEPYFRDLAAHLDTSVAMVWTGNTVRSLSYDAADIRRATQVYGRKPMIFDNTPYARSVEIANGGYPVNYPERSSLCNIFEPFDIQYPDSFPAYLDERYYSNNGGFGEVNMLKYLSFADFSWNTRDYNPDLALFKSLVNYVGRENAPLLVHFNTAYYAFVTTWGQLRIDRQHDSAYQCSIQQKDTAEQQIVALQKAFAALAPIDNPALKKELGDLMDHKIAQWRKLSGTPQ